MVKIEASRVKVLEVRLTLDWQLADDVCKAINSFNFSTTMELKLPPGRHSNLKELGMALKDVLEQNTND